MGTAIAMSILMNIAWMVMITKLVYRCLTEQGGYSDIEEPQTNDNDFTKEKESANH